MKTSSWHHVLILALLVGCGGAPLVTAPEGPASESQSMGCLAVEDPSNPFIVEWSNSATADLIVGASRGGVIVSYDGCRNLKVLRGCRAAGEYSDLQLPAMIDTKRIANMGQLYASLPLAAARLKARVAFGQGIELTTVLTGRQELSREPDVDALEGDCLGASHYVEAMDLGASSLRQTSRQEAGAEVSVLGAGGGASASRSSEAFGGRGDPVACQSSGLTAQCRTPFRIRLKSLDGVEVVVEAEPVADAEVVAVKAAEPEPAAESAASVPAVAPEVASQPMPADVPAKAATNDVPAKKMDAAEGVSDGTQDLEKMAVRVKTRRVRRNFKWGWALVGAGLLSSGIYSYMKAGELEDDLLGAQSCFDPVGCGAPARDALDEMKFWDVGANVAVGAGAVLLLYSTSLFDGLFSSSRKGQTALLPYVGPDGGGVIYQGEL